MGAGSVPKRFRAAEGLASRAVGPVSDGRPERAVFSGSSDGDIDLRTVVTVLRRRIRVLSGTVIIGCVLAIAVVSQITPQYTASTAVMLNTRQTQVVDFQSVMSG